MGWDCSALRLIPKSRQNQAEGQGSLCHRKTRGLLSQHSFQGPRAEDCRPRHWEQAATSHLKVDSFGNDCNSQARAYHVHLHSPPQIIMCMVGWELCMPWHICGGQKTFMKLGLFPPLYVCWGLNFYVLRQHAYKS